MAAREPMEYWKRGNNFFPRVIELVRGQLQDDAMARFTQPVYVAAMLLITLGVWQTADLKDALMGIHPMGNRHLRVAGLGD